MKVVYTNYILAILGLLIITEYGSFFSPILGRAGAVLWILAFLIVGWESLASFFKLIQNGIKRAPVTLFVLLFFVVIIILNIGRITNSNSETTQEISCALTRLESPDMGFRSTCLFGYPARQFLFTSLPSSLFGRNVITLNVGGAAYFIAGLFLFTYGLTRFFESKKYSDLVVAILVAGVFHFYYVNWFLFSFEQSIYPLSFSLGVAGLFLSINHKNYFKNVGLIGILLAYLIFSYTTGLFFVALAIGLLLYLFFTFAKERKEKVVNIAVILTTVFFFISSLFVRWDIHILGDGANKINIARDVLKGVTGLLIRNLGTDYVSAYFHLALILALIIPFFTKYRKPFIFIFLWIVAVIVLSIASHGYAYYSIDFRLHRSIIIVPPLLVIAGVVLDSLKIPFLDKKVFYIALLAVFFITGFYYQSNILKSKINSERHRHASFIMWLKDRLLEQEEATGGVIVFDDELKNIENYSKNYISIQDSLKYYLPRFETCSESSCNSSNSNRYYVKIPSASTKPNGEVLGTFTFDGDDVKVFKGK